MKDKKTCENCTNKYLCTNFNKFGTCMGWGDRQVFIGLIKLMFAFCLPEEFINDRFKFIEDIQNESVVSKK